MHTPEEAGILEELAVEVAHSTAKEAGSDVVLTATRNDYIDRLTFAFEEYVSRGLVTRMLGQLVELGVWIPESVRWKALEGDLYVRTITLVRLTPALRTA